LNDFWIHDLQTAKWVRLPVDESEVPPREGARGVLVDQYLWIFGGYFYPNYLTDLHVIDITTGQVTRPVTTGPLPSACSGQTMTHANGKIIIYGGFNGSPLSQCHILDIHTLSWTSICTSDFQYSCGYCVHNDLTYVQGGSNVSGITIINPFNNSVELIQATGSPPPPALRKSSLINTGRYLISMGGEIANEISSFFPNSRFRY
jgi:N-acetylneuraminic acid mutarotase